jgi:hypothetical protein
MGPPWGRGDLKENPTSGATRSSGPASRFAGSYCRPAADDRIDRPTHSSLARAVLSSCDDHHKKAFSMFAQTSVLTNRNDKVR